MSAKVKGAINLENWYINGFFGLVYHLHFLLFILKPEAQIYTSTLTQCSALEPLMQIRIYWQF